MLPRLQTAEAVFSQARTPHRRWPDRSGEGKERRMENGKGVRGITIVKNDDQKLEMELNNTQVVQL